MAYGNSSSCLLLNRSSLRNSWDGNVEGLLEVIEGAFLSYAGGDVIFPEKSSQIFDELSQSRINCMPATVKSLGKSGVKWVSVFPNNPRIYGLPNVGGLMVLSETETGQPVCVMDASFLTALRTAAVDVLAAKHLSRKNPKIISIIGNGEQAIFHARLLSGFFPTIEEVRISGRSEDRVLSAVKELLSFGIPAKSYGSNYCQATTEADIVVTAISGQEPLLKSDWISPGTLYCHVGGWEDEFDVALKADKIVCDDWESLKHRGSPTIAKMYVSGQLRDNDIYCNLSDLVSGKCAGRTNDDEFIYFNGIGLSFVDVAVAEYLRRLCERKDVGSYFGFYE